MKLTIKEIAHAAMLLSGAKCSTLSDTEFNATLKMANVICPILEEAQKAEERIRESARTANWDEIVTLARKSKQGETSEEETKLVNNVVKEYNKKVYNAISVLEAEERDIDVDLLPASVPSKLMRENNWTYVDMTKLKKITLE